MGELRILVPQLGLGHAARQQVEKQRDPETRALDAGPAAANFGIDGDAVQQSVFG